MSDNENPEVKSNAGDNFNDNPLLLLLIIAITVGSAAIFNTTFAITLAVLGALFFLAMGERRRVKNQ